MRRPSSMSLICRKKGSPPHVMGVDRMPCEEERSSRARGAHAQRKREVGGAALPARWPAGTHTPWCTEHTRQCSSCAPRSCARTLSRAPLSGTTSAPASPPPPRRVPELALPRAPPSWFHRVAATAAGRTGGAVACRAQARPATHPARRPRRINAHATRAARHSPCPRAQAHLVLQQAVGVRRVRRHVLAVEVADSHDARGGHGRREHGSQVCRVRRHEDQAACRAARTSWSARVHQAIEPRGACLPARAGPSTFSVHT